MAEYLIQQETLEVFANQVRRILGTEDKYTMAEVAEKLSFIEGSLVEGTGEYTIAFIDYDGTVIKEVHADKGQACTFPAPPEHDGLKFLGWVSCMPIKSNMLIADQASILVSPMYDTVSGATEYYVTMDDTTLTLSLPPLDPISGSNSYIDWGDGTPTTTVNASSNNSHTYSSAGDYVIKVYNVDTIGGAGDYVENKNVTKVHLSSDVTVLYNDCFAGYTNLTGISMSNNLQYVFSYAFLSCKSLTHLVFPASLKGIIYSSLNWCDNIKTLLLAYGITDFSGNGILNGTPSLEFLTLPETITLLDEGSRTLADDLYYTENNLYFLPSVNNKKFAFIKADDAVTDVNLPSEVKVISDRALYENTSVKKVVIPDDVGIIPQRCFCGCTSLSSVAFGNASIRIEDQAFCNCTSLTDFDLTNVSYVGNRVFYGSGLTTLVVPETINVDGDSFAYCKQLKTLVLNKEIYMSWAFEGCESLSNITFSDKVTFTCHGMFKDCTSISNLDFLANVKRIQGQSFYGCTGLASIDIPEGVVTIEGQAFEGCTGALSASIPKSVTSIGNNAFNGCTGLTTAVYEGTEEEWANVSVSSGNTALTDIITFAG